MLGHVKFLSKILHMLRSATVSLALQILLGRLECMCEKQKETEGGGGEMIVVVGLLIMWGLHIFIQLCTASDSHHILPIKKKKFEVLSCFPFEMEKCQVPIVSSLSVPDGNSGCICLGNIIVCILRCRW